MVRPLSVHFLTLGCPKNEADSRQMTRSVSNAGFLVAEDPDSADVVVVNTCSFIQEATEQSIETILELSRDWKGDCSDRHLVVAGCLPSRYRDRLAPELPEVDAFMPVDAETGLADVLRSLTNAPVGTGKGSSLIAIGPSAYLTVSDGCDRTCSYCTIPAIRGPFRSRHAEDIDSEARSLVSAGARELVLVGQDVSSFGKGGDFGLPDLVRRLAGIEGLDWLRLMYVQPEGVTPGLLDVMADHPQVCEYLDIPLQHASRDLLRRMGRSGDAESHLELLARIRDHMPEVILRTTLIAGFPGETEEDLTFLEDFLREARIEYVGVFAYSPEDGTPAAEMPGRIPANEVRSRARHLRDVADEVSFPLIGRLVGSTLDVLVEEAPGDGILIGRWRGQAPEVDGVVHLEGEAVVGDLVTTRITGAVAYDLIAETDG